MFSIAFTMLSATAVLEIFSRLLVLAETSSTSRADRQRKPSRRGDFLTSQQIHRKAASC